ncbi:FHA domain-containing protein [Agreia sp. COWG]|uniref:FHA domain-containing protein n=1 Tax=Agreia sp. COWG TaxID=2773266 RepID=UPI001928D2A9|nr:FHA domain-containing protein [Agreia sp. COWG]CAD6000307.1 FHA domain-containing protein [Agreia sp. COWG]
MKCKTCGTYLPAGAMFCGECGNSVLAASATSDTQRVEPLISSGRRAATTPRRVKPDAPVASSTPVPATFTLVFSTGERVEVTGGGLVGRNPTPAAGEESLALVRIVDPQLSVSKTHLEFGVEAGLFWVSDRRSGNGTTISVAGRDPLEAVPGERYGVSRGTRIRIGEQFFDVL